MILLHVDIICDQCNTLNVTTTGYIENFHESMIKSFWCKHCEAPQVVQIRFSNKQAIVEKRLKPESIYVSRKPDTGITIRPRGGKPRTR